MSIDNSNHLTPNPVDFLSHHDTRIITVSSDFLRKNGKQIQQEHLQVEVQEEIIRRLEQVNDEVEISIKLRVFNERERSEKEQYAKFAFQDFLQTILDSQNAGSILEDVFHSKSFINKFEGSIDKARDPSVFIKNSQEVYRSIIGNDIRKLKSQFSCSTKLLKQLISTEKIKYIENLECHQLLSWYIKAIERSEELDIEGVLHCFSKIAKFEGDKVTPCKTDSIVDMYVSNVRSWLTHYTCSFNMVGMFDKQEEIVPVKSILYLINKNIENFKANEDTKFEPSGNNKPDLLTSTSLYKCMLIMGDAFSLLRQWVNAYYRKCEDNTEGYKQFIKVLDTIESESDLISRKIPFLIDEINNEHYSNHAENYATFTLHKIAIFLFKVGSAIENFMAENKLFSPEGCENTLEQVLFSIKIFVSSYNYSLGLEDLDCISSYTSIDDIYKKYQQGFAGVEEFLRDEDAINPFVLNGLDGFIPEVLEAIKDDGFFANHNSRDSEYFLTQYEKKLRSFETLNPHLFDKNQPKMYNNVVDIRDKDEFDRLVKEMEEKQESKFCTLLEHINESNQRFNQKFEEQQERFNQNFDEIMNFDTVSKVLETIEGIPYKQKLRKLLEVIRKIVDQDISNTAKQDAIYKKINSLQLEIDRNQTTFDAIFKKVFPFSFLTGKIAKNITPLTEKFTKLEEQNPDEIMNFDTVSKVLKIIEGIPYKQKLGKLLEAIRKIVDQEIRDPAKQDAIYKKINALQSEIDRNQTTFDFICDRLFRLSSLMRKIAKNITPLLRNSRN